MDIAEATTSMVGTTGQQWKDQMLGGKLDKRGQIDEIAKQFEGILVRQYLDEALKPIDKDSGLFGMKASPMHEQLIKDSLANSLTQHSSLGFSSVLQAQLYSEGDTKTLDTK